VVETRGVTLESSPTYRAGLDRLRRAEAWLGDAAPLAA
jgi:hypothetical protein